MKRYACVCAAIAEALHSKVCVQATKKRILDCLEDPQLKKMVSVRWSDGCVHVLPMGQLNAKVKTVRKWRIRRTEKSRNALIIEIKFLTLVTFGDSLQKYGMNPCILYICNGKIHTFIIPMIYLSFTEIFLKYVVFH